ncbi:MAG: tetratricopeptide repeat protein, partial [Aeoliella sp.]
MLSYYRLLCRSTLAAGLLAVGAAVSSAQDTDTADPLADAKSAMRAAQFDGAIKALENVQADEQAVRAEAMYLKSLAQFYLKEYQASIATADSQIAGHPNSSWLRKARFLKARSLVALRRFEEAEEIYQEEAHRLLSEARKHEIAGVIIQFADALAKKPDPNDVGALPPDFGKAYKLYGEALAMEIGRDLRDEVMFKQASAILQAGNHGQAIKDFRAYLAEFDPEWTGAVGTATRMSGRKRENPKPAGVHILASRYHLTEAQLQAGQHAAARVNAEDLLPMIAYVTQEKPRDEHLQLEASTAWLLVRTYKLPTPTANELDKAVQVTREFLKSHTDHPRAVQAAWFIPEAYRHHGRADEAIVQYEAFIAGDGFTLPRGDAATDKLEDLAKSPAELASEFRETSLFRIGQIRYGQKKYDEAIDVWNQYINQFPNGPNWSDCQRGIVDAEYQAAVDAVADKDYRQASELFETFLAKHPLDGRAARVLYVFGQIDYVAAEKLDEEPVKNLVRVKAAYSKAIDRWQRVVSKYPNTEESSLALYRIGVIYEEQLGQLEKALETYRRLTWGSWASHAQSRLARMTEKQLTVTTERKFRTNETATVNINTRNIEKLKFKQYFLDLEAYFRKTHSVGRVDGLDIDLIQPDKTWEVEMDGYAKYTPLEQHVEIPFADKKAGVCIVNVSGDDFEATTLVVRSDLDLIVKSSRREVLVFVQDMLAGKPAEGVKLLVSNGEKVLATGMTGADGVFQGKYDELKEAEKARVFAMVDGSVASNLLDLSGLQFSQGLSAKGYLYTDRPAYQPGQTVKFRGIVRDVR